ncbi:hypothetical protein NON08_14240 [Cetobacterium somerae]|uniref:hypothetical protein n=1 Tax=Cetobacterium sp. NK01 TaxID=2993530 RepID=UPI002115ECD0|nr:hypothetical protein [Cetobacterium sp. NK01]MCQ8213628.1 hypothetical protein [Cetobacterium sp. NK01]MCQ8213660.1 hypothetical protein [Cetobacterium sp. NK01]
MKKTKNQVKSSKINWRKYLEIFLTILLEIFLTSLSNPKISSPIPIFQPNSKLEQNFRKKENIDTNFEVIRDREVIRIKYRKLKITEYKNDVN